MGPGMGHAELPNADLPTTDLPTKTFTQNRSSRHTSGSVLSCEHMILRPEEPGISSNSVGAPVCDVLAVCLRFGEIGPHRVLGGHAAQWVARRPPRRDRVLLKATAVCSSVCVYATGIRGDDRYRCPGPPPLPPPHPHPKLAGFTFRPFPRGQFRWDESIWRQTRRTWTRHGSHGTSAPRCQTTPST